jgi:hypothetical protein
LKFATFRKSINVERLLTATALLAEVLRAYPWLLLVSGLNISGWPGVPLSFLSALVIITAVTFVLSNALRRGLNLAEVRVATLSLAAIVILFLIRLENSGGAALWDLAWFDYASGISVQLVGAFGFGLFLVWRAISISREDLRIDWLYRNFAIGVAGFVLLMVVWAGAQGLDAGRHMFGALAPYILGYFFAALMGIGISNFLSLRKGLAGKPKATDLFARRWLLLLLGIVFGIVVVGAIIASGLSLNLMTLILQPLNTVAGWLAIAFLYVVGYPLGYLVEGLAWIAQLIINWLTSLVNAKPFESPEFGEFADNANKIQSGQVPEAVFMIIKWVLFLAILSVIIYFLSRAIYRYWRGNDDKGYDEIHESLWSWAGFSGDLKTFLKGLGDRFRRAGAHASPPLACTMTEPQFLDVRELYRGLLWEGNRAGHPKPSAQTPFEYAVDLKSAVGRQQASLEVITDAYVRDRYGHLKAAGDEGMALVHRWLSLRSAMRGPPEEPAPK